MLMTRFWTACAVVGALLAGTSQAHAAGLNVPDVGAASLGKGGADAAAPTGLTAIFYNPAALASQQGFRFLLDARGLSDRVAFQRVDVGVARPNAYANVENGTKFLIAPAFGASYGFTLGIPFAIAIGGTPPPAYSGNSYPDFFAIRGQNPDASATLNKPAALASPQRYTLISDNNLAYTFSL
jgi:long-subunit fatty acid transport protein